VRRRSSEWREVASSYDDSARHHHDHDHDHSHNRRRESERVNRQAAISKWAAHREAYRNSHREDLLGARDCDRDLRREWHRDSRRSRKRAFRAAMIWSSSVAVAAVGVAYGVGTVVEMW
jgi:hypothetical protein